MKRMKQDVVASSKMSRAALEKAGELDDRVERNERNSRQLNRIISGFMKDPSYHCPELREEKHYLMNLLEKGTIQNSKTLP